MLLYPDFTCPQIVSKGVYRNPGLFFKDHYITTAARTDKEVNVVGNDKIIRVKRRIAFSVQDRNLDLTHILKYLLVVFFFVTLQIGIIKSGDRIAVYPVHAV